MKVCLWVQRIELFCGITTIVDKVRLHDDSLFGGTEFGRQFVGKFMLHGGRIPQVFDATLSQVHLQGYGRLVTIRTDSVIPEPPYLLTDDLKLNCVFDGAATLRHVSRGNSAVDCGSGVSVVAQDWFGFAFSEHDRTRLVAFSEHSIDDITTETVYAPCWEIAPEQSIERPILIETTKV